MPEIIDDLNKELELDQELKQQPEEEVIEEEVIPEKFKGKSSKEIAESYVNLEKELGRKAQEIGELRSLTDQILRQQISDKQQSKPVEPELTDEDFFVDPRVAINKAIENHPKIKQAEEFTTHFTQQAEIQKRMNAKKAFYDKHSDADQILQEQDFLDWVGSSPVRQRLFAQANNNYDFVAGDEIFSTYKELKKVKQANIQMKADEAKAGLKAAGVPSGSTSSESSTKVFRRADLIRLRMNDPARYEAMSEEILKAYSEGRVK